MVTKKGYVFLDKYYDKVIGFQFQEMALELKKLYANFKYV